MTVTAEGTNCVCAVGIGTTWVGVTFVYVFITVASLEAWWTLSAATGRMTHGSWTSTVAQT